MKSINIIGAFDRYNYGDLLFPIIIEEYIKKYNYELIKKYKLEYYALVQSDLSKVGGKKTKALSDLYNSKVDKGSYLIVSGGDVLAARIGNMDIDLCKSFKEMIYKKVSRKLKGIENFEKKSKSLFNIDSSFPWVVDEKSFNGNLKVIYNAVGGSTIDKLPPKDQTFIIDAMKNSSYISVRDNKSKENIVNNQFLKGEKVNRVDVAPDSATIMSEIFTLEYLEGKISDSTKEFIKENKEYIVIQSNNASLKSGKDKELVEALNSIGARLKCKILLLPIGFAANHDDNIALEKVGKQLKIDYTHIKENNIYDIMYLIGKGKFFAGTSLHGNITAMSYGVPHIGLNKEIKKLDMYLSTWDLKEQNGCISFNELNDKIDDLLKIDKDTLLRKREELIEKVKENFKRILALIEENNE
ncbi:polysaccharide pyruvyl transferase family protein [Clostridium massiliamazoniense]|uniref:polysaccharide pyruvyl transferase family protein n=1 Tax=Clostridium massiliamazoniense TaxID=1347366 RepID=UPI0006D83643|nr:polysaccharide pyruvyl transferase family protein [Clostridium massiliamazoniense]